MEFHKINLKNLCLNKIAKLITINNELPKTIFSIIPNNIIGHTFLKNYKDIVWKDIFNEVDYSEDGFSDFFSKFENHNLFSFDNYPFGYKIESEYLFKYILWSNDFRIYYDYRFMCVKFNYYEYENIYICENCFLNYENVCHFSNMPKQFKFKLVKLHHAERKRVLHLIIRNSDNWCSWCIRKPLFSVESYKKCAKRTHRKKLDYIYFNTSSSSSDYEE